MRHVIAIGRPRLVLSPILGLVIAVGGCNSPLGPRAADPPMKRAINEVINREIATIDADTRSLVTSQPPPLVEESLQERRAELDAMSPASPTNPTELNLGMDLSGAPQGTADMSLESVILAAVKNNLSVRIASLQPAVNAEDVIRAEAAFDVVLFHNTDLQKIDEPQTVSVIGGTILGTPFRQSEDYRFETGVQKRMYSGGSFSVSTDLSRFQNNAQGVALFPDPAYTARLRAGLTQPLLRGFGRDVNTAEIRITENAESAAVAELSRDLLLLVLDVEVAYWRLLVAWGEWEIQQWLVDVGVVVRDHFQNRLDFDVKPAEASDAVARVEQRKADVIRAAREVKFASDVLKGLINDPDLSVASESILKPSDAFVQTPLDYNYRRTLFTALTQRPEVEIALLDIDDASIRRLVAENAKLPLLDVTAQIAYFGMDDNFGDAYGNMFDGDFIDYVAGLRFEYPLGNRAAEAEFNKARLQSAQSFLGYERAVQDVILDVKSSLRDVVMSYELIAATRSNRVAQAENLRALIAEEPLRGLTVEFLDLKFQRQERLALARREEIQALQAYDASIAGLYRAMGVSLSMRNIDMETVRADHQRFPVYPGNPGHVLSR